MTLYLPVYLLRDIFIVFSFFFSYPKYSSCEHSYTGFFIYFGKMPSSVILESYDKCSIMFQRDCHTIFSQWLIHFTFLSAMYEGLNFIASLPEFYVITILLF